MPGIRRVQWWNTKTGYHIPSEHDPESDHLQYCQSCLHVGVKSELKKRLYRVESVDGNNNGKPRDVKLVAETVPAPDADRFRQCYRCGDIVPIYNVKQESALVDFVEPTLNPFDESADSMGSLDRSGARLAKKKNKYARKKAQIDSIKDPELKTELAQGNTLKEFKQK
jgi:hypothetical protein